MTSVLLSCDHLPSFSPLATLLTKMHRYPPLIGGSLLAAALIASGCKDRSASSSQSLGDAKPSLELLHPGGESRQKLAYAPAGAARARKVMLAWKMSQPKMPVDREMHMTMHLDWRPPTTGGDGRFAVAKVEPPPLPPGASRGEQQIIEAIYAGFARVAGRVEAKGSSHFRFVQTRGPPTRPSVLWMLHAVTVPLPAGTIGVGARWRVTQVLEQPELRGISTRVYELLSIDGTTVKVRVSGGTEWKATGTAQRASGDSARVTGLSETVSATMTVDVADLLPRAADATLVHKTRFQTKHPGRDAEDTVVEGRVDVKLR